MLVAHLLQHDHEASCGVDSILPSYRDDTDAIVRNQYSELSSAFSSVFHSSWYERLVLVAVLSNSAYLMTYNTELRPSESAIEASLEMRNSSFSVYLNASAALSEAQATNISFLKSLRLVVSASRSLSTDSWWHIFFFLDLLGQQVSEGSLAAFVSKGDKLADFIITIGTTIALIVDVCTLNQQNKSESLNFFNSLAIFRLIRITKISFLRPL